VTDDDSNLESPQKARSWRVHLAIAVAVCLCVETGCALRTIPPIRYLPLFGKEKEITTTALLVTALKDRDVVRRAEAVDLLGLLSQSPDRGLKREVARVLGIALKDRDPGLRLQVVEKFGAMESEFANKYLLGALKDPNPFVREKVLSVLGDRERTTAQTQSAQN
jgi:HEAT repeat protein